MKLRPYQVEGIDFLKSHKRALLSDAPGLGKTIQATEAAELPVLVFAPVYLVEQWGEHINNCYPKDTCVLCTGTRENRLKALLQKADWTICNIEMLRSYNFPLTQTLIIDEAHHLRGRTSQQGKKALEISKKYPRVYLLTGTPIVKEVDDLYMLLRIIDRKHFGSYWSFVEEFCRVEETPWSVNIVGAKDPKRVREMLSNYALGRSYKEVGLYLPELIEQVIYVDMWPEIKKAYKDVKKNYRLADLTIDSAGQMLVFLRNLTSINKADTIQGLVEDAGHKTVVFCWYKETAYNLAAQLNTAAITGDMSPHDRVQLAKQQKVVVATISSLSEGIDLSAARTIIFAEEDYVPGTMYQAIKRVERWSKEQSHEPVRLITVLVKNSIDTIIHYCIGHRIHNVREIAKEALK